ncbi:MAG: hypothetical protein HYR89_10495 [Actinobacteria bacterium]|nr:hypothetical protein [Actinomycetota bacterium]MBI3256167.1 hypothetical protein [Actinomycetota bacterium]
MHEAHHHKVITLLRRALLGLAVAGIGGTAAELIMLRHWDGAEQLVPWAALAVMSALVGVVVARPTGSVLKVARVIALVAACSGAYGLIGHAEANFHAGPLDAVYGPKWATMTSAARWWTAGTGGVGPSPPLAPAILTQIALSIFFATHAYPRADVVEMVADDFARS